jgi:hypothetical protein
MRIKFIFTGISALIFCWFIFQSCHKTDQGLSPDRSNEAVSFKKEAQKWWENTFVKSEKYDKTDWTSPLAPPTGSSTKRFPIWRRVATYKLGEYQVAEMPLFYETNTILLPGMQKLENTPEGMRIARAALHRMMVFKKPDGSMVVRTVTIVPTPEYAKKMNYDISRISLKKLPDDFGGYLMVGGWNQSKKNIVRFEAGKKPRTVKILTGEEFKARKAVSTSNAKTVCDWKWVPEYIWVCVYSLTMSGDSPGGGGEDPCDLYGHWEQHGGHWEYQCWEEPDPEDPEDPDPFQECLNNGGTYESCNCQLYNVCNDPDPGGDPDPEDPPCVASPQEQQEFDSYVAMTNIQEYSTYANPTPESYDPIENEDKWKLGGGLMGGWSLMADYEYKYNHYGFYNTNMQRIDEYDIYYFNSGNPYITGSNLVITSTYSNSSPIAYHLNNNNSPDCYEEVHYRGKVEHSMIKIKTAKCTINLNTTNDINVRMKFYPR